MTNLFEIPHTTIAAAIVHLSNTISHCRYLEAKGESFLTWKESIALPPGNSYAVAESIFSKALALAKDDLTSGSSTTELMLAVDEGEYTPTLLPTVICKQISIAANHESHLYITLPLNITGEDCAGVYTELYEWLQPLTDFIDIHEQITLPLKLTTNPATGLSQIEYHPSENGGAVGVLIKDNEVKDIYAKGLAPDFMEPGEDINEPLVTGIVEVVFRLRLMSLINVTGKVWHTRYAFVEQITSYLAEIFDEHLLLEYPNSNKFNVSVFAQQRAYEIKKILLEAVK